ncbi:MAG: hypothetical protein JO352_29425 [Chloroflexi bacterium]|nr:hypothetical protein [Chloroflexota bacterium]
MVVSLALSSLTPTVQAAPAVPPIADLVPTGPHGDDNPPSEPQTNPVPAEAGEVSASGGFTYSRALTVPAARGPVPRMSLAYSSNAGNGIAGFGWQVVGLPAIARVRADSGISFGGADTYALLPDGWGGAPSPDNILVNPGSDSNWYLSKQLTSPAQQFRPSSARAGDGPSYWTMRDGKGITYYFGGDETTSADASNPANSALWEPDTGVSRARGVVAWALYKVMDANGNYYRVTYHRTPVSLYVSHIQYNLPFSSGSQSLLVRFSYEARTDVVPMPQHLSLRLNAIRVYAGLGYELAGDSLAATVASPGPVEDIPGTPTLVREYVLGYASSVVPGDGTGLGVSLLSSIREYGSDADSGGVSLEPTTFSYTDADASTRGLAGFPTQMSVASHAFMTLAGCNPDTDNAECKWQTFIGDLDGDGRADIIRAYYGDFGGYVQYTCGANDGFSGPVITHSSYPADSHQPEYLLAMADVNGDGKQDLIAVYPDAAAHTFTTYVAFGQAGCTLGQWEFMGIDTLPAELPMSPYDVPPPSQDAISHLPPHGNWRLRSWRLVAADVNGDGLADIILYDNGARIYGDCIPKYGNGIGPAIFSAAMVNRVLYQKLSSGASLGAVQFFASANLGGNGSIPAWRTTEDPTFFFYDTNIEGSVTPAIFPQQQTGTCAYLIDYEFNGIVAEDVNGDGRADIVASWSSANQIVGQGDAPSGVFGSRPISPPPAPTRIMMAALGGSQGLGTPQETGWVDPVPLPTTSGPYWPSLTLRTGDINGDGVGDVLFNFQGSAGATGYGRFLQSWLGSTTSASSDPGSFASALFTDASDPYTYPYAANYPDSTPPYNNQAHLNNWDYFVGDVNGDGIDDFVEVYRGAAGSRIGWAAGAPTGMAGFTIVGHPSDTSAPLDDGPLSSNGGSNMEYRRWDYALGDLNHDGMADLVMARVGGASSSEVTYIPGTTSGLAPQTPFYVSASPITRRGDSRFISVRLADITAGGAQTVLIINDNGEQADSAQIEFALPPAHVANGGMPNLLERVDNGLGAITTVTYQLARDMPGALRADLSESCGGPDAGQIVSSDCGQPDPRPRPLVSRIDHDDGQAGDQLRSFSYAYTNGRLSNGRPSQRGELGFESVTRTDLQLGTTLTTHYRQQRPFQALPSRQELSAADGTLVTSRDRTYSLISASIAPGVNFVALATDSTSTFEQGVIQTIRQTTYRWNSDDFTVAQIRDSTIFSAIPEAPDETDSDVVTDRYYAANDLANWYIGKLDSAVTYRDTPSGGVPLAVIRTTYDPNHPLRVSQRDKLLLADSSLVCKDLSAPWAVPGTCSDLINTNSARWVTTFQDPQYDQYGNLRQWQGIHTTNSTHAVTLEYDAAYQGLVTATTNALRQTQAQSYSPTLLPSVTTDSNQQSSSITYDVYGRAVGVTYPGISSQFARTWTYRGLTQDPAHVCQPVACYLITTTDYSDPNTSHSTDSFQDGSGRLVETLDHVAAGDTYPDDIVSFSTRSYANGSTIDSATEPHFLSAAGNRVVQTTYDSRNRPVLVRRESIDSGVVSTETLNAYHYDIDGSTTITDANGHVARTSHNARGLLTRATDATGNDTVYSHNPGFALAKVTLPSIASGTPSNPGPMAIPARPELEAHLAAPPDQSISNLSEIAYTFDGFGRLTSRSDALTHLTTYTYDDAGKLLGRTSFRGVGGAATGHTSYAYDALDRILREGDGSATKVSYVWDGDQVPDDGTLSNLVGRLTAVVDQSGTTFFAYDARGNLSKKFVGLNGLNGLCLGGEGQPICGSFEYDFGYDDQNRLLSKTLPAFPTAQSPRPVDTFTYSKDGVLTSVSRNGDLFARYAQFNAVKQVGWAGFVLTCGRRPGVLSSPAECWYADTATYKYQDHHLLESLRTTRSDGSPIQDEQYAYDAVGNLTSIVDNRPASAKSYTYTSAGSTVNVNTDAGAALAYDADDRLTTWSPTNMSAAGGGGRYEYDPLGNVVRDGAATMWYTNCGSVRAEGYCLTSTTATGADWSAEYDSEGKQLTFTDYPTNVTDAYGYDYRQRLTSVSRGGTELESYTYNYQGEQTSQIARHADGSTTTTWLVAPDFQVQQRSSDPPGKFAVTWSVGDVAIITAGDAISGQASSSTVVSSASQGLSGDSDVANPQGMYLRMPSRLGSTTVVTTPDPRLQPSAGGAQVSDFAYDAWGAISRSNGDQYYSTGYDTTAQKFTGQRSEGLTGLLYYHARYYSPRIKRFLTADDGEMVAPAASPDVFNRFAYARNNPQRFIDPTGHQPESADAGVDPIGRDTEEEGAGVAPAAERPWGESDLPDAGPKPCSVGACQSEVNQGLADFAPALLASFAILGSFLPAPVAIALALVGIANDEDADLTGVALLAGGKALGSVAPPAASVGAGLGRQCVNCTVRQLAELLGGSLEGVAPYDALEFELAADARADAVGYVQDALSQAVNNDVTLNLSSTGVREPGVYLGVIGESNATGPLHAVAIETLPNGTAQYWDNGVLRAGDSLRPFIDSQGGGAWFYRITVPGGD